MPLRRNEVRSMIRQEPFAYRAAYDANKNLEYEGWSYPGADEGDAVWTICKHTHDANYNLTHTKWTGTPAAEFNSIWTGYTGWTYV